VSGSPSASSDSIIASDPAAAIAATEAAQALASAPTSTPTVTPTPTITLTPTITRTPTATPNPVHAKFTDKPDNVDTGSDAHFEVETNAEKATCAWTVKYHNTSAAGVGSSDVEDDKCEITFNLPDGTKTGEAKISVTVTGKNGTVTIDDDFDVNKGDTFYTGDVNIELELTDSPDDATVGDEVKVAVQTNMKKRGTCDLTMEWPKIPATTGEQKTPDGDGKCSWAVTVPSVPKKGTTTLVVTIHNKDGAVRVVTKEFDVKLP